MVSAFIATQLRLESIYRKYNNIMIMSNKLTSRTHKLTANYRAASATDSADLDFYAIISDDKSITVMTDNQFKYRDGLTKLIGDSIVKNISPVEARTFGRVLMEVADLAEAKITVRK